MTYHFAFTDVHGCLELYKQAMNYIETFCKKQNAEYRIFYLGDAADRGKDGWQIINELLGNPSVTYLMGNHEMLLIEAVRDIWKNFYEEYADGAKSMIYRIAKSDPKRFISISSRTELYCYNGGESTLLDWAKHGVTMKTINQLASLPVTATYRHYDMCHSGCKINEWKNFLNEGLKVWGLDSLIWNRDHLKEEWREGRVLLHGHTSTSYAKMYCHTDDWSKIKETSPLVYRNGTKIDLDIASVKTGLLTVFNLDSDSYAVIDKDGNVKEERKI